MSDVKDELKHVLEAKKRFTDENVDKVFQKIDAKQVQKQVYWKPLFASFTIIAALLTLFFLLPKEQKNTTQEVPNQITETPDELKEKLIKNFEEFTTFREIVYSKIGFEKDNLALIISQERDGYTFLASIHEYVDNEWKMMWTQVLEDNQLYLTDEPFIIYSGIVGVDEIDSIFVGEKEIEPIYLTENATVFVTTHDVKTDPVIINFSNSFASTRHFIKNEDEFLVNAPLVNREDDEFIYKFNEEAMQFSYRDETNFELVIDPSFNVVKRYDVVLVDDGKNAPYLSRIVALPDERFKVENGTIILNKEPQHTPYGSAKVDGFYVYDEYVENRSLSKSEAKAVREIFTMNVAETHIPKNQYMLVSDNWLHGNMTLVKKEHIKGVVKGYTNEWSTDEKQLYQQMEATKNKQLLKNIDPKTVARLYLYASYLADSEMQYYFFTTTPGYIEWTYEEHIQDYKGITSDKEMRYNQLWAKGLRESTFVQNGDFGYLKYTNGNGNNSFILIKNTNGYWEVAFSPLQFDGK